jgi:LysM repeat protein
MLKKLFLVITVLALALGYAAVPASAATCAHTYTVQHGDSLYSIGLRFGVSWQSLAKANNIHKPYTIYSGTNLCIPASSSSGTGGGTTPVSGTIPTFSITAVKRDVSVSIQTANFPANDTFNVLMGPMGTKGIGGTKVGTFASGAGGSLPATFNIPSNLHGSHQIAIRLESPTSGFFAYNWFFNNTAGTSGTGGTNTPTTGYSGFPTFSIASVVRNTSVTIHGTNFPPNDTFNVLMGPMGTQGINGTSAGTYNSGGGGSFTATFTIPANLHGSHQIAIRLQSPTSGFFAYNWFFNNNAP